MSRAAIAALLTLGLAAQPAAARDPVDERPRAYALDPAIDVPVLVLAVAFNLGRSFRSDLAPAYCAPPEGVPVVSCDRSDLNALDRPFAGRYHPGWNRWSDVGLLGVQVLGAGAVLLDGRLRDGLSDLVVVAEATLIASAASGVSTQLTGRPRPFMYGTTAPIDVRREGTGGLSFFSGHTSTAFGAAVSAFVTLRLRHPHARWTWAALGVGLAGASFVGATRILAGWHFPSDVVTGAAVGSAVGVLVPAMHAIPRTVPIPIALPGGGGLGLVRRF